MSIEHTLKSGKITVIKQQSMLDCPHRMIVPEHYRPDGSCRCDDINHLEMGEWGYTWNGVFWQGDDSNEEG